MKLREAHYESSPQVKPRAQRDRGVDGSAIVSRASAFGFAKALQPAIDDPQLVSSSRGSIHRMLLTVPSYVFSYTAYSDVYEDLLSKLPQTTEFLIVVHGSTRPNLEAMLAGAGADSRSTVVEIPEYVDFSFWAEDAFAITQSGGVGSPSFVEPASFSRREDALIADIVSAASDLGLHHASLYFQGGNMLIGDDFWLLGSDYATRSLELGLVAAQQGESDSDAVRREYRKSLDTQKTMHILGSTLAIPGQEESTFELDGEEWTETRYAGNSHGTAQPVFHIDMFVTLADRDQNGKPIALVGDPRIAAEILQEPTQPHALAYVFDDIAHKLELMGFQVVRNPLPLTYEDVAKEKHRYWYFASANNALVEISDTSKRVWLPTYGHGAWPELAATDDENERIWQELDFDVTRLGDFHPFASNLGAVHCITKYLERRQNRHEL